MNKCSFLKELYEYRVSITIGLATIIGFLAGIAVGLNGLN